MSSVAGSLSPQNLFVVILRYLVPMEQIDTHRSGHLAFLDQHYATGTLLVSGRQVPATGGVLLAKALSRQVLEAILRQDPFSIEKLAEYQIFEFTPNRYSSAFAPCLAPSFVP